MKNGKRIKVITPSDTIIIAVSYCRGGGVCVSVDEFTVFEHNGVYYYTDWKDVYTIPKKEFYRFVSKVQKLHLEEINGYEKTRAITDGFGYSFHIMYNDGTIIAGHTGMFYSERRIYRITFSRFRIS